ncbi:MAG TPA: hypothetical protein VHL11_10165 [Phototrophicaceae bacterium]|jgi:hypothetical protein|nr:hypothetical protein [Phototrophicaceae bacterium]
MAIDYVIDYDCVPRQIFSTDGILDRLKGEERANTIIALFRENGDDRPPSEMGFEFSRNTPTGEEERRVIVVQELLDAAKDLYNEARHCVGCPANRTGKPFGCTGFIQYPVSGEGERWMLDQLPVPDEALTWLLLKQGVEEFQYDGATVRPLRESTDAYFEDRVPAKRRLGEFDIDANQLFEMIFAVGHINPNHAALLLLFLHALNRDLEAEDIMQFTPAPRDAETRYPFLLEPEKNDDHTVLEFKTFFHALYLAWRLNVRMMVDA